MVQGHFWGSGENDYHFLFCLLYKYCFYFLHPPLLKFAHSLKTAGLFQIVKESDDYFQKQTEQYIF